MRGQFTAVYESDGDWIMAYVEEVPGVNTQGKTIKEARENLKDALTMILQANRKLAEKRLARKRLIRKEQIPVNF